MPETWTGGLHNRICRFFWKISKTDIFLQRKKKKKAMDKIKNPYLPLRDKGYNCFACSPWNTKGLKMEFWEDGDDIVSVWTASGDYQSWTDTVHGGIQATLLDEVGGWYVTRKLQTAGVTSNLNIRYRKTVPVGKPLEIRVRLKEMRRNLAVMEGSISCEGTVCTTAEIIYFTVSQEKAREDFFFSGCELEKD